MSVHATAIMYGGRGVLIRGSSGSGKSTLAAFLLQSAKSQGVDAALVSDDQVILECDGERLVASAPEAIAGLIELRGFGPLKTQFEAEAVLNCVIDIVPSAEIGRMPDASELEVEIDGIRLRRQPVPDDSFVRMQLLAVAAITESERICR